MEKNMIFFVLLSVFAGVVVTFQGPINTKLGESLGSSYWGALATFIVGFIGILIFLLVIKEPIPSIESIKSVSLWQYLGGLFGAIYVISIILIMPHLGPGLTTVILMISQIITAMLLDHFGAFGYNVIPFDFKRLFGVLLMALGIYLINKK